MSQEEHKIEHLAEADEKARALEADYLRYFVPPNSDNNSSFLLKSESEELPSFVVYGICDEPIR